MNSERQNTLEAINDFKEFMKLQEEIAAAYTRTGKHRWLRKTGLPFPILQEEFVHTDGHSAWQDVIEVREQDL